MPTTQPPRSFPPFLRDGDIVFRMGRGLFSPIWGRVGAHSVPYSHVGIFVEGKGGGHIIHTEANEFTGNGYAREEPFAVFLGKPRAASGTVFRPRALLRDDQRKMVVQAAQGYVQNRIPFDVEFDLATHDRLYCSELIWRAFKSVGIELAPRHDVLEPTPFLGGKRREIISLNNLLEGGGLSYLAEIH